MTYAYPLMGTCDGCAEGPQPVRETDPDSGALLCARCDALNDRAVRAAAAAMDAPLAVAARGVEAYLAVVMDATAEDLSPWPWCPHGIPGRDCDCPTTDPEDEK